MSAILSLTEADVRTALRSFLLAILPGGIEVIRAQDNDVSEPSVSDYVVMNVLMRPQMGTGSVTYAPVAGTLGALQPTQITVQLDVHGPNGGDNAQAITAVFRTDYACQAFAASGFAVQPLYAGEPRQMAFINGEAQFEDRWVVDAVIQANPVATLPQQFADTVQINLVGADATYHSGAP